MTVRVCEDVTFWLGVTIDHIYQYFFLHLPPSVRPRFVDHEAASHRIALQWKKRPQGLIQIIRGVPDAFYCQFIVS